MRRLFIVLTSLLLVAAVVLPAAATRGVGPKLIKVGLHVPLTGAAPIPSDSAEKGKDLYFRWLRRQGRPIARRHVRVVLKNDQYNPSTAVAVCKELVEDNGVFMLSGFTGPDQINSCSRFADSRGVPYVAPGTTTAGLHLLDRYFSSSTPWPRQARMLADFLVADHRARRRQNAVVYYGAPTWRSARRHFVDAMENKGADVDVDRQVPKTAGSSEARATIAALRLAGVDNVFVMTTPVFFLQLLNQAATQGFDALWTGIGLTMTHDVVARTACGNDDSVRARFFSPYPATADRDRFDPAFSRALKAFYPDKAPDDVMWGLWAQQKVLAAMFKETGRRLTRSLFVSKVERGPTIRTGILPPLDYSPRDHFGGKGVHVLKMNCQLRRWETARSFVNDF